MRSLKFKYYDSVTKQFVYSGEFKWDNEFERLENFFAKAKLYAKEVEQWTGLQDVNGIDIYEGDIMGGEEYFNCRSPGWMELRPVYVVFSVFVGFGLNYGEQCGNMIRSMNGDENYRYRDLKIIGNIHQDPELLK